jgi:hypothetical protein
LTTAQRRYGGDLYRHKLEEGDDPVVIAKRLTLAIWRSNTGGDGPAASIGTLPIQTSE